MIIPPSMQGPIYEPICHVVTRDNLPGLIVCKRYDAIHRNTAVTRKHRIPAVNVQAPLNLTKASRVNVFGDKVPSYRKMLNVEIGISHGHNFPTTP